MSIFCRRQQHNHIALKVAGTFALAAITAGLIVNLKSIKRYIRISMM